MKQAELLELIAGKRQGQVVAGLLQNFSQVEAALNAMETATGSAAIEFEKYMQGLEYKSERLSAIFTSIWLQGISSDTFKNIIDAVTVLTIGVEKLTRTFGLLPSVLAAVSAGMMLASTKFRTFIGLTKIGVASDMLTLWLVGLAQKFNLFTVSVRTATVATRIFQATATFGASIALGLIFDKLISSTASYADTLAMTTDQQIEAITTTGGLVDEVDRLVKKLEEGNLSQQEQLDIQKRIAQLLPNATTGYTDQNEALAENIDLIIALNDAKRDELELRALDVIDSIGGEEKKNKLLEKNIQLQEEYNRLTQEWQTINKNGFFVIDDMGIKIDLTQEKLDELTSAMKNNRDEYVKNRQDAEAITRALEILAPILGLTSDEVEKVTDELLEQSKSIQDLDSSLASLLSTHKDTISTLKDFYSALKDVRDGKSINIDTIQKLIEADKDFINVVEVENGVLKISQQALEDLIKTKEEEALVTERAEVAKAKAVASNISARLQLYGVELDAIKTRSDARNAAAKLAGADYSETAHYESILDPIGVAQERLTKLQALLGTIKNEGLGDLKSSTSSTKTPYQALIDEYYELNNAITEINNLLSANSQSQDLASETERIRLLERQNELYAQQEENISALIKAKASEQQSLRSFLESQGFSFDAQTNEITNYQKQLERVNSIHKGNEEQIKKIEEALKNFTNLRYTEIPGLNSELQKIGTTIIKNRIEIENMAFSMMRSVLDMQKKVAELDLERRERASNAQLERMRSNIDSQIASIQSEIDGLESQIKEIETSERLRSERIERAKRLSEISEIQNKLYYIQNNLLENMSEEQAKQLGLEREREESQRRLIRLQELQDKLENLRRQRTIQQLQQMEDGTFDYVYVADQNEIDKTLKEIETVQTDHDKFMRDNTDKLLSDLQSKQESYAEWERSNDIRNKIEALRRQVQYGQDRIRTLNDQYNQEQQRQQKAFSDERQRMSDHYRDMDILTKDSLEVLRNTMGDQWDLIHKELTTRFESIKASYEELVRTMSKPLPTPSGGAIGGGGGGMSGGGSGTSNTLGGGGGGSSSSPSSGGGEIWNIPGLGNVSTPSNPTDLPPGSIRVKHKGGIVGQESTPSAPSKYTELINKMFNVKPNEEVIKALKNELFIPEQNIINNGIPNLKNLVNSIRPVVATSSAPSQQVFQIDKLVFPNVESAREIQVAIRELPRIAQQYKHRE